MNLIVYDLYFGNSTFCLDFVDPLNHFIVYFMETKGHLVLFGPLSKMDFVQQ